MAFRKLTSNDMGMAEAQAALHRPVAVLEEGTGSITFTFPTLPDVTYMVTDIIASAPGGGTLEITENGETVLKVDFPDIFAYSFKISINLNIANPCIIKVTGQTNAPVKLNVYGHFIRR